MPEATQIALADADSRLLGVFTERAVPITSHLNCVYKNFLILFSIMFFMFFVNHNKANEQNDGSDIINILSFNISAKHNFDFFIEGQIFNNNGNKKDYNDSIRNLETAIKEIKNDIINNSEGERKILKSKIQKLETQIEIQKSEKLPKYSFLEIVILKGRDLPAFTKYTESTYIIKREIPIDWPVRNERMIGYYVAKLKAPKEPGDYTAILTPLCKLGNDNKVVFGGSDTIDISIN